MLVHVPHLHLPDGSKEIDEEGGEGASLQDVVGPWDCIQIFDIIHAEAGHIPPLEPRHLQQDGRDSRPIDGLGHGRKP